MTSFNHSLPYAELKCMLTIRGREVDCRISQPVGTFICHINDLDISDSITVAPKSLGPWQSPLASRVL